MPRRRAALVALLVAMTACTATPPPASSSAARIATLAQQSMYHDGDLVFRRGRDVMSGLVLGRSADSRFSHVGMVVVDADQRWVVHAMPDEPGHPGGVRRELLADFLAPAVASDAAVYRLPQLHAEERKHLREYLLSQLGRPFDFAFALSTPDRLYCSELVLRAVQAAGLVAAPRTVQASLVSEPLVLPDALRELPGLMPVTGG